MTSTKKHQTCKQLMQDDVDNEDNYDSDDDYDDDDI